MADGTIQMPGGAQIGPNLDTEQLTVNGQPVLVNGQPVHRERHRIAGANPAELAAVIAGTPGGTEYGLVVRTVGSTVVNPSAGAEVALSAPPTALTANADTLLTFASQVRHLRVQNKSGTRIYIKRDAPASLGSEAVYENGGAYGDDIPCTVLHIYSTAPTNINGTTDNNIFVEGRL